MEEMITLDLFNSNVKNVTLNSSIEENNFQLVRDYLEGNIIKNECGFSSDYLDYEFITENLAQIKHEINSSHCSGNFKNLLQDKLDDLFTLFVEFKVYNNLSDKTELDSAEIKVYNEIRSRLFYLILELRVSLGLDLEEIFYKEIYNYCDTLATDVNNGKYKRLDFQSHINDDGQVIRFK